jgi:hypothetical protein
MGMLERLNEFGDRANELADKATERARELVAEHNDKIDERLDRAAGFIDEKTKGKYSARIDAGVERTKTGLDRFGDNRAGTDGTDEAEPSAGPDDEDHVTTSADL